MFRVYNRINQVAGNVISVDAADVRYGELAVITTERGRSLAEVIHIRQRSVLLQVFAGSTGISTDDEVRFLGHGMRVSFSDNLLGRIFNGAGKPLDHGPELLDNMIAVATPTVNPAKRIVPSRMIRTGIPMIDVFNTLVVSQKLPIFSIAGEPYNALLCRIALQAVADVIVIGGMGLKYDEYLYFRNKLENDGAINRSVFFIHKASDPVVESILVPDISLTVAERFALKGKTVLVLLTDMTNFSDALKEVAITMEKVPSSRGYPGDLYSQLARRYEKAVDFEGAGSITILSVTTMPGDDVTHPVPDNTGYITEGQLYLHGGTIDPFGSLSRLKQLVNKKTRDDHRELMDCMIRLFATFRETLEKKSMGFTMTEWDEKFLRYGEIFDNRIMDLNVNIPLEAALDRCWEILAMCFEPDEVGMRSELIDHYWPASVVKIGPQAVERDKKKADIKKRKRYRGPLSKTTWRMRLSDIDGEAEGADESTSLREDRKIKR